MNERRTAPALGPAAANPAAGPFVWTWQDRSRFSAALQDEHPGGYLSDPHRPSLSSSQPSEATTPASPASTPFTSRPRRNRRTRTSVKVADAAAATVITAGGLGVVVAFAAIVGFLVWVVIPLFGSPEVEQDLSATLPAPAVDEATSRPLALEGGRVQPTADAATVRKQAQEEAEAPATTAAPEAEVVPLIDHTGRSASTPVGMSVDENLLALWVLDEIGNLNLYRLDGAELIDSRSLSDARVTAISNDRGVVALGLEDGTVMTGSIGFALDYITGLPDALESLSRGQTIEYDGGVADISPGGALRVTRVSPGLSEPVPIGTDDSASPIRYVDYVTDRTVEAIVALREDARLFYAVIRKQRNMLTGQIVTRLTKYELPRSETAPDALPKAVLMGRGGRQVYVVYENGHLVRYNTSDPTQAFLAEEANLLSAAQRREGVIVSTVEMLLGDVTLIVGASDGSVAGWFAAPYPPDFADEERNPDGERMVRAHNLSNQGAAVTAVATSSRDRQFITGDTEGRVVLRHMTSGNTQATLDLSGSEAVRLLDIAPKNNAIIALDAARMLSVYRMDNPHPDGTLTALFTPVHYEGRAKPEHFWQSSAGTDDAELKFGLMPLIFGTLKATVYAMLFAVPIAILAAIYSAEFMHRRVRAVVKPTIELMAGLPSVVLGFIAALVLAPFVENVVPAVLLTFAAVPVGVLLFGFIWQVLPPHAARSLPEWLPFAILVTLVLVSVYVAFQLGGVIEQVLFFGSFRAWVDGRAGQGAMGAVPGWIMLLTAPMGVLLAFAFNAYVRPKLAVFSGHNADRLTVAVAELVRFVAIILSAIMLAAVAGYALGLLGLDLRGGIFDTYVQRNALNVGIVMGFAVIPIIYTVSEDALSSVPNSLRSAALGAGATPWQTAVRVVLPVAMSGIFSACMIGLGRAAGETMIVLMAAGNTPIIDWNLFSGLRTLSANIAVELPEAPVGSTHYRVLFLSALVLFAITFVVNTAAEMVRLRFRKRAYQL